MICTLICAAVLAPTKSLQRDLTVYGYPGDGCGIGTASGDRFDPNRLAIAVPHRIVRGKVVWEIPKYTKVTLRRGDRVVRAIVNDVMASRFWGKRVDGTPAVWRALGGKSPGKAKIVVEL